MEHLSEKKKKIVQPVEEQKPNVEAESNATKGELTKSGSEKPGESNAKQDIEISLPFEISEKAINRAESLGIPIKDLLNWAASVEYKFQILAANIQKSPQETVKLIKAEQMKARAAYQKKLEESGEARQGSGQLGELASVLKQAGLIGGGGSGMDEEMYALNKELLKVTIDSAKANILNQAKGAETDRSLSQAIKKAITEKIAGKAAADILD